MQTYLSSYRLLILSTLVALSAALPAQETRESNPQVENDVKTVGPIRHPGATAPSFTLSIRGGDDAGTRYEFRVGSIVAITISMTNTTNHDIDYSGHFRHLDEVRPERSYEHNMIARFNNELAGQHQSRIARRGHRDAISSDARLVQIRQVSRELVA